MKYSQWGGALLLCGAMVWTGSSQAQPPAPQQVPRADGKAVDKPREDPRTPAETIDRQLEQLSKTMMLLTPEMKRAEETLKKFPAPSPCASSEERRQAQGYGSGGRKQGFGRIVEISPKATKEPPLKAKDNPNGGGGGGGASKDGKVG